MATLFISDLHLNEGRPEVARWLRDFLAGPARRADALYILGDLFEYWIGDDALSPLAASYTAIAISCSGKPTRRKPGSTCSLRRSLWISTAGPPCCCTVTPFALTM